MITLKDFLKLFSFQNIGFIVCSRNIPEDQQEELGYSWVEAGPIIVNQNKSILGATPGFLDYWGNKTVSKIVMYEPGEYIKSNGEFTPKEIGAGIKIYTY